MDKPVRAITEYAAALDFESLPQRAVHSITRHLLDALACAVGALDSRPARVARRIAAAASSTFGASVFALPRQTTPEYAAFANTAAVRHLDYNDTGIGGHPSDMIPAVLAVAEPMHASGRDVIRAIFAEYEVVAALRRAGFRVKDRHVDQVLSVLGSVVGAGIILELTREQMANAISLAITPNIPMRVVRTGEISDWKGCATAHCAMMAVFSARLAKEGLTGPGEPFEGVAGLYDFLRVGPFDLERLGLPSDGLSAVEATSLKYYPAEYSAQGPLGIILALRPELNLDEVEQVNVALHRDGWEEIGGGQGDNAQKWNPGTRETADHSLPYLIAAALVDGGVSSRSFSDDRVRDPALRLVMQKITVTSDPELTRQHAGELPRWPSIVEIVLKSGERIRQSTCQPKGHAHNPMSDGELEAKFWTLADGVMSHVHGRTFLDTIWALESLHDISQLTGCFREIGVHLDETPIPAGG